MPSPHLPSRSIIVTAAVLVVTAACGDSMPSPTQVPPQVAEVRIETPAPTLRVGESAQLAATPLSAGGSVLAGRAVSWLSEDPAIAHVTELGLVTGLSAGTARLRATSENAFARINVPVQAVPGFTVTLNAAVLELDEGESTEAVAVVRDSSGAVVPDAAVSWVSFDEGVIQVGADHIHAMKEGETLLRARFEEATAVMIVRVRANFGGELLYVSYDVNESLPRIYRTDLRNSHATTISVFSAAGTKDPSVSPDGTRLVYTCRIEGSAICVANIDGTAEQVLTAGDAMEEDQPSWSPDGSRIAFRRWAKGYGVPGFELPTDLWTMTPTGADQVNLTMDAPSQHLPAWSAVPVGGAYRIAFVQDSVIGSARSSRIATMRADGGDRRLETEYAQKSEFRPTWSPDGTSLLFTRLGDGAMHEILVLELATRLERRFLPTPLAGGQFAPVWSPNGRYVIFSSQHEQLNDPALLPQVYSIRADGTHLTRRTFGGAGKGGFVWRVTQ